MKTDIILIDDSIQHLQTTFHLLSNVGLKVTTISDPLQAIAAVEADIPKLIIMDIMMPGIDGFALLKQIKENSLTKSIPVIILSGKVFPPDMKKAITLGAEKYLNKPINSAQLIEELKPYI